MWVGPKAMKVGSISRDKRHTTIELREQSMIATSEREDKIAAYYP